MKPQKGFIKSSTSMSKMPVLQRGQIMQTKPQSSRNSSVNDKHTSSLINIKSESQKTNSNEIRIRVFSNYGNPSFISCSEIDIINQERQKVQILSIKLEPKRNAVDEMINDSRKKQGIPKSSSANNLNNLFDFSKLTNGSVMEGDEYDYWHAAWPPEFPMKYVDIVINVKSKSLIDSLRIWPNKNDTTQNFKHISVFLDQHLLFDNEIENEFGLVIPLHKFDSQGNSRIIGFREEINHVTDDYGIIPVKAITKIEIDFLQSYRCSDQFGLQMIKFYNSDGDPIDVTTKGLIECINCGDESTKTIDSVFSTKELDPTFKWICELNNDSKILVKFLEATIISAIMFITLPESFSHIDLAIKQVRIKSNGINTWCGKIDRGDNNLENARARTNIIFLYDNLNIKEKIYEDAYKSAYNK